MSQPEIEVAVRLFSEQRNRLAEVRKLDYKHPDFKFWQDTTASLFQRFIRPDSPHLVRFREIRFRGQSSFTPARRLPHSYRGHIPPRTDTITPQDKEQFQRGCSEAENCIQGAIEELTNFGAHVEAAKVKSPQKGGGFQQTFHGPVTIENQLIATDRAIQNIEKVGGTGASLKEIADLLNESLDLTGRQRLEALKGIEIIADESTKPEQHRNWKSIMECGEKLLEITGKASDVATKLAPHLQFLTALVHSAASKLGL